MSIRASITVEDVRRARERIVDRIVRTPLIEVTEALSLLSIPGRWWVKVEALQRGGAFKFRGASARITAWLAEGWHLEGVVTYSSGNHGMAVALAARTFGLQAVIAVPETIPAVKLEAIRASGAEAILAGNNSDHRHAAALDVHRERGFPVVEPFDDPEVISGQGTIGLELLEDCPDLSAVVVPVGGGGLITGIAIALDASDTAVQIHAVEPVGCDALGRSLQSAERVRIEPADSLADGLRPVAPGVLVMEHGIPRVATAHTVDDGEILRAMRFYQHPLHLVAEPSGAATLAALLARRIPCDDATCGVLLLSGGNADWASLAGPLWRDSL